MAHTAQTTPGARVTPPFRADHVGSLLRPPELLEARGRFERREISADQLRAVEDDAIRGAIRLQQDAGLQSITDGEFRRGSWHMDFIYQLGGIVKAQTQTVSHFRNASGSIDFTPSTARVAGEVGIEHTIFGEDFTFLRSQVDAGTPKLTIPSPSMVHYRGGRAAIDGDVYPDMESFWSDLAHAYRDEIARLSKLGCTYLQLDDTSLAYLNDPSQREAFEQRGEDGEHQHMVYIRTINAALAQRPEGMTITTHMCRGNFRSSWVAEGGYDFVAEPMFSELAVDAFFMEYDDDRSGTFEPLRFVPRDKLVVLGLVTTKRGELESKDALKRRIEEATRYLDIDQICISPQCGFSSTVDGNALTLEQQAAKLRLVVETAGEVWGSTA
jgi:5-methyltetrahydropteroyltriglutamate--homocysteine methyltransferase